MPLKLSHSGKNKYISCSESFRLHYIERIRSQSTGSALIFGANMDLALNLMLLNKDKETALADSIKEFETNWLPHKDNPNIDYFKSDFDIDLIDIETSDGNWHSLYRKAGFLLSAYHRDILPQIKEVIEVQKSVELLDDEGNNFNGIIDAIVRLQDGRVVVMDNKTSASKYEKDSVAKSDQLAIYQEILNIKEQDPADPWKYKIEACAYAVMSKKLNKKTIKTCQSCGNVSEKGHKLCDAIINKKRCNGTWSEVKEFSANTQFIVGTITEEFVESVLEQATAVKNNIEDGVFEKNYDACNFMFGKPCVYRGLCYNGDMHGLVQIPERKENV